MAPNAVNTSETFVAYATSFGSRIKLYSSSNQQDGYEYARRVLGISIAGVECFRAKKKPDAESRRMMLVQQSGWMVFGLDVQSVSALERQPSTETQCSCRYGGERVRIPNRPFPVSWVSFCHR